MNRSIPAFAILCAMALLTTTAQANVKQLKTYREVYPDYKPKCFYCHTDETPKKDEGKHDLNKYGLKLQEIMNGQELTADMVRSIGSHEECEAKEAAESAAEDVPAETEAVAE